MGNENWITTSTGKKIFYDKVHGVEAAKIVKEELDNNTDLYNALLDEYDAVVIGECNDVDDKVLKIENLIKPEKKKIKNNIYIRRDDYVRKMIASISLQYKNPNSKRILEDQKKYQIEFEMTGYEPLLYSTIVKEEGSIDSYIQYLYMIKDYNGIKLLCQSSNDREFEKKYLEVNLEKVLNRSFELFMDKGENNFLEKNISLISKAIDFSGTEENLCQALMFCDICNIEKAIKSNEIDELSKQKCFETLENVMNDTESSPFIKRKCNNIIEGKNINDDRYISDEEIIRLVRDFLSSIDGEEELLNFFDKKIKEGKIILYKNNNIEEKKKEVKNKIPKELEGKLGDFFDGSSLYVPQIDACFIATQNRITDVPTIVHEFIHQYRNNKDAHNGYLGEVPSIFFERLCGEYLINNGWNTYRDEIMDDFVERITNDSINNCCKLKQTINLLKCKFKKKVISIDDVLSDEIAMKLNELEFGGGVPKVDSINNIKARKIWEAKKVIKKNVSSSNESILKNRTLCSYAIGTYIASKYLDDERVIAGMLELTKKPDFRFEYIIENSDHINTFDKLEVKEER